MSRELLFQPQISHRLWKQAMGWDGMGWGRIPPGLIERKIKCFDRFTFVCSISRCLNVVINNSSSSSSCWSPSLCSKLCEVGGTWVGTIVRLGTLATWLYVFLCYTLAIGLFCDLKLWRLGSFVIWNFVFWALLWFEILSFGLFCDLKFCLLGSFVFWNFDFWATFIIQIFGLNNVSWLKTFMSLGFEPR